MKWNAFGASASSKLRILTVVTGACLWLSTTAEAVTYSEKFQGDLDEYYSQSLLLSHGLNTISGTAGMWRYLGGEFDLDYDTVKILAAQDTIINSASITVTAIRSSGFVSEGWGRARLESAATGDSEQAKFDLLTRASGYFYSPGIPISLPATFELPVGAATANAKKQGLPLDFNLFLQGDGSGDFKFEGVLHYDYRVEIDATLAGAKPVPVPAALPLLAGALGFLGYATMRRRRVDAARR